MEKVLSVLFRIGKNYRKFEGNIYINIINGYIEYYFKILKIILEGKVKIKFINYNCLEF